MTLFSALNAPAFVLSFVAGILICYMTEPAPQVVVKFPSPHTAGKVKYRDQSDGCFMYRAEKHACPRDRSRVSDQPVSDV